jgi:hypothetical protein
MPSFEFLSSVRIASATDANKLDHIFYSARDIALAEEKLGSLLPKELVSFYSEVIYGFFWQNYTDSFNRLLSPKRCRKF